MPESAHQIAGLLAAVPFLAAVVAGFLPTVATPIAAAPARPALAFDQYLVDLREVRPRPLIQAHFDFTNTGTVPVTITELKASCGCLAPQLHNNKATFQPDERGRFYVTMKTANEEPGPHAYTVAVRYDDTRPREETLQFRLILPELKVSVEPSEVYFYQLLGTDDERTIYVSDRRRKPLEVLGAACSLEHVRVEVLPPETAPEGFARVPVKVFVPGDYPAGRHTGFVTIATTDPDFGELRAAIMVESRGVRQAAAESDATPPQ